MIINIDVKDFDKVKQAMDELIKNVGDPFEKVLADRDWETSFKYLS